MLGRDVLLQVEDLAQHRHKQYKGSYAREDGPGYEVDAEHGVVPGFPEGHGENPGDHRVDRDRHRDDDDHHHPQGDAQALLLAGLSMPPQGGHPVEPAPPGRGPVPQPVPAQGKIGDEGQVEVDNAPREIRADGQDIPDDRRLPATEGEYVQDPVRTPQVYYREEGTDHKGNHSDELGHAGDGGAPPCLGGAEDGGDEGTSMGYADEEDEQGDIEAPGDAVPLPGDDEPLPELRGVGIPSPDHNAEQE